LLGTEINLDRDMMYLNKFFNRGREKK